MIPLNELQCFIFDMDGTMYLGSRVIPGAKELLLFLNGKQIPYYFFTNNSSKSVDDYITKLENLGLGRFTKDRIITSGDVTANYILKTFGENAKAYLIGTESLLAQFSSYGISSTIDNPDCVVVGFDTTYSFEKAKNAVDLLREGVPFLATNIDAVCPLDNNMVLPDCASICAMLTHATGFKPKFLGKPSVETALYIQSLTKIPAEKTAIVGDRLYTDMQLALDNNMCAIAMLSGEMTRKDIEQSDLRPHFVFGSAKDLHENLKLLDTI